MNASRILAGFLAFALAISVATATAAAKGTSGAHNSSSPKDLVCIPVPDTNLRQAIVDFYTSQQELDRMSAPIHSHSELAQYLNNHRNDSHAPLDALPPKAKKRFLGSLRFNNRGLTTFSYADLRYLTAFQVYKILSLFGVQRDTSMTDARIVTHIDETIMTAPANPLTMICFDFGGGHGGPGGDRKDYKCVGEGSCFRSRAYICTQNC